MVGQKKVQKKKRYKPTPWQRTINADYYGRALVVALALKGVLLPPK